MSDEHEQARRLGLAALALDEPPPPVGARPTLGELTDWMAGELSETRAAEVRRHVARDPAVYEEWRQLRLAMAETKALSLSDKQPAPPRPVRVESGSGSSAGGLLDWLRGWLGPVPLGAAFATVAAVGIGIGVFTHESAPPTDFWGDWQTPKSLAGSALTVEERPELGTVLIGMREQMRELSLPAFGPDGRPLPSDVDGCAGSDASCEARREALRELGKLGVLSRIECNLGADGELTAERQRAVARILATLQGQGAAARLAGPLEAWASAETRAARCAAVDDVLSRSLNVAGTS